MIKDSLVRALYSRDAQSAGNLAGIAEDFINPGGFMQIIAVRSFAFKHGNEIAPVWLGRNNATHLNLLANYATIDGITITR